MLWIVVFGSPECKIMANQHTPNNDNFKFDFHVFWIFHFDYLQLLYIRAQF